MNEFSILDMVEEDTVLYRIENALRACGLPLSLRHHSYQMIRTGAWHDVYRVTVPQHAHPFIVRIRKSAAYGQSQSYDRHADDWRAEYTATSLYYMQANRAQPQICPTMFLHHVSKEITCTVETYMGESLQLDSLTPESARRFGRQIGTMMRTMHQTKTHITGAGELAWDGANLYGITPQQETSLSHRIEQAYNGNILLALTEQAPRFDHEVVRQKLQHAQQIREVDLPMVLINRDVTPENLTVQRDNRVGIIDPYPYLGDGTRFAAWFIHCYRFLLPNYAQTARYHTNGYDTHAQKLAFIADGFEKGYLQGDEKLRQRISAERWLWALEQAYDDMERLDDATHLTERIIHKHGAPNIIRKRLKKTLRLLEKLDF